MFAKIGKSILKGCPSFNHRINSLYHSGSMKLEKNLISSLKESLVYEDNRQSR